MALSIRKVPPRFAGPAFQQYQAQGAGGVGGGMAALPAPQQEEQQQQISPTAMRGLLQMMGQGQGQVGMSMDTPFYTRDIMSGMSPETLSGLGGGSAANPMLSGAFQLPQIAGGPASGTGWGWGVSSLGGGELGGGMGSGLGSAGLGGETASAGSGGLLGSMGGAGSSALGSLGATGWGAIIAALAAAGGSLGAKAQRDGSSKREAYGQWAGPAWNVPEGLFRGDMDQVMSDAATGPVGGIYNVAKGKDPWKSTLNTFGPAGQVPLALFKGKMPWDDEGGSQSFIDALTGKGIW